MKVARLLITECNNRNPWIGFVLFPLWMWFTVLSVACVESSCQVNKGEMNSDWEIDLNKETNTQKDKERGRSWIKPGRKTTRMLVADLKCSTPTVAESVLLWGHQGLEPLVPVGGSMIKSATSVRSVPVSAPGSLIGFMSVKMTRITTTDWLSLITRPCEVK